MAESNRAQLLGDIQHAGEIPLKHVGQVADRSAPVIDPDVHIKESTRPELLQEIAQGVHLKHVDEVHDHSAPVIEEGVHVGKSPHKDLLQEVVAGAGHRQLMHDLIEHKDSIHLHHVETVDKGKPVLDPSATVHKWDKEALLDEIEAPHKLKHVDTSNDRSAPQVSPDVHIKHFPHKELMQEVVAEHHLKHVDPSEVHDGSQPQLHRSSASN